MIFFLQGFVRPLGLINISFRAIEEETTIYLSVLSYIGETNTDEFIFRNKIERKLEIA